MNKYVRKRLLQAIPVIFGITILTFFIMKMAPGGPLGGMLSPRSSPEALLRAQEKLGLNKPIIVQYWNWLKELVHGNFGYSTYNGQAVLDMILERLPATLLLTVTSFLLSYIIGIPLGVYSATHKYSKGDYGLTVFSFFGISIPSFFFGMGLIYIFALKLRWLPTSGFGSATFRGTGWALFWHKAKYLIMPAMVMSLANLSTVMRFVRSSMIETLSQDYIRTARAKGVPGFKVIFGHALKNSLIPVITYFGPMLAYIVTGSIVVEQIFAVPGIGRAFVNSITGRDYPLIMGTTIILACLIIIMNLVSDLLYKIVDPRIELD